MANSLYGLGRQGFLDGSIDWDTDNVRLNLVDNADYTVSIDADNDMADVDVGGAVESSTANLGTKTVTLGTADAANTSFSSVSGDVCESIVIAQNTGTPANDRLIAYIDTATGLPVTPNGGDINVTFDAAGIFTL